MNCISLPSTYYEIHIDEEIIEVAFLQQKQGGEVLRVKILNLPISEY